MSTLTRRSLAATAALLISLAVGVGAGSVALASPAMVQTTPPATEPPPETAPAETTPAETTAPEQPTTTGSSDDENNTVLLLMVLLVVLVVGVVAILMSINRRSTPKTSSVDSAREQENVVGAAQWFHDQLSVQLMGSPPEQALQRWAYERRRIESIVHAANQQAHSSDDPWYMLANSVTHLMGALDTLLGLRAQHPPDADAIVEATNVATRRRNELQALLASIWPMVRGH